MKATASHFVASLIRLILALLVVAVVNALDYHAEHSIPSVEYQLHFNEWLGKGYRLVLVTGFQDDTGAVKYNAIWQRNIDSVSWLAYHGLTETGYQTNFDEKTGLGYRPVFVDGFSVSGSPRINVIYHNEANPPQWVARHGQTSAQYQNHFDNVVAIGYDLDIVSSYELDGVLRLANLFSRYTNNNAWAARHGLTSAQYQDAFDDLVGKGYSLEYVSVGTIQGGAPRFAARFVKANGQPAFVAFHDVSNVQAVFDEWIPKGYIPKVIDAYKNVSGNVRWALLFTKEGETLTEPKANDATFPEIDCFDQKIIDFLKANGIPGAGTAVLNDGKLVYAQGFGVRDVPGVGTQAVIRKVSQCTPFRLASVSKPVTSLAILRLVQMGMLTLSDRVFGAGGILQHMSDNPKPCCPIADSRILLPTVYQLLTHTGGWDRDIAFDPMFRSETVASALGIAGPSECQDIIYYMFGQNLQHDPGTTYAYSNFGYCILGRVIEQVTGLNYEEAVRQVLLDPAGVSRDEMYIGSTQLIDIPEPETEYYCPGCPLVDSVFPSETDQVPNPYGDWYIEAMDAHGAWVASAPQLMQMLSATADPHCNGTIADQNTDACLLWDTSIDSLTEKPSIYAAADSSWYGLGFSIRSAGTDHNWWHLGSLPGTYTIIVRTNAGYGYAWAMLVNVRGFAGNIDSLMWDAVSCVNDNWPKNFQSPCDFPDPPKPAAPTPSPPTPECKVSFRIFQWLLCLWRNWRNRG